MEKNRPFWVPDTQGSLAIAIIGLVGAIVLLLLLHPITLDDKTTSVLTVVIGVLVSSLKDVYSFYFGSSKGSAAKDETINKIASGQTVIPPTNPSP